VRSKQRSRSESTNQINGHLDRFVRRDQSTATKKNAFVSLNHRPLKLRRLWFEHYFYYRDVLYYFMACRLLHRMISHNTWPHPVPTDWLHLRHMRHGRDLQKSLHKVRLFSDASEQIWIWFWTRSILRHAVEWIEGDRIHRIDRMFDSECTQCLTLSTPTPWQNWPWETWKMFSCDINFFVSSFFNLRYITNVIAHLGDYKCY